MGRIVRRVPLDFQWGLNRVWSGFLSPPARGCSCAACGGMGYSPEAKNLFDRWWGRVDFDPVERGSTPHTAQTPTVRAKAERNSTGRSEAYVVNEAERLARHFNSGWQYHLNQDDVDALVDGDRLRDFTHTWTHETGWVEKSPPHRLTPQEVNAWAMSGMGHDTLNAWIVIQAECKRLGAKFYCAACTGGGFLYEDDQARRDQQEWTRTEPPVGDGWQMWETVSEGSPVSPVCASPEALARWLVDNNASAGGGEASYSVWLSMIGAGWAPSMMTVGSRVISGVEAVAHSQQSTAQQPE